MFGAFSLRGEFECESDIAAGVLLKQGFKVKPVNQMGRDVSKRVVENFPDGFPI